MISKHCGQKLFYTEGRFMRPSANYHAWKCIVCGRHFVQQVRQSKSPAPARVGG